MPLNSLRVLGRLLPNGPGSTPDQMGGLFGEEVNTQLLPRYTELTRRGLVKTISTPAAGVAIAAANNSPLAAGTGQPILGIWNPDKTDTIAIILRLFAATRSGTPGGPLVWNTFTNPSGLSVVGVKAINNKTFQADSICNCFVNSALTGGPIGVLLRPAFAMAAVAAASYQGISDDDVMGSLMVYPNSMLALASIATGTTHVVDAFIEFAEVPLGLTS